MTGTSRTDADVLLTVFTQSHDYAVIRIDVDGRIEGWLGAAARMFGYAADEAIGRDFSSLFVEEDVRLGLDRQEIAVATASGRSEDDRWHIRKDGSRFWGSGVLQAVLDNDGSPVGYCKILRDRSDWRTRTKTLENEVEQLSADLRRRTEFIVSMIHELRNPLAPISAAIHLLDVSREPAVIEKVGEVLKRQMGVLTRHLDDLYQASQAAVATMSLKLEPVVVNAALAAAVNDERQAALDRGLDLKLVLPAGEIVIDADPQRLQQMMQNLLSNAIKYTPAGGRIVVSPTVEATSVAIRVEDTGVGIAPEMLPRIFELFTREEQSQGDTAPSGLGVGLAMVKTFADLHGGSVEARSFGKNRGSVFVLRLPLRGSAASARAVDAARPSGAA
ncbi:PAS domain-containing sensor histidine kinase [Piscinibacter koreensis]|uniref:histidine kinase n=1 Tax=Piscinibacter koreensis TaxID=2742824 RepID=A0A7Y6TVL4_9BURK|nr:PAS domain-containing sensor histidine kinase [Schlegelella koreensis]NUZ05042.1 PAS domain-containing sensor histidine kinase [Schlegelella koreensis]